MKIFEKVINVFITNWIIIVSVFVSLIAGITIGYFVRSPYKSLINNELSNYSDGKWIVKVDNRKIGDDYFKQRVDIYQEINSSTGSESPVLQDIILKKLIDNYLILNEISDSGIYNSHNFQKYVWFYAEEAMVSYYLDFIANARNKKDVNLSANDKEKFYNENKALFDKQGKSHDEALALIDVQMKQLNNTMVKQNRELNQRIELGRLKKGKKIEFNLDRLSRE